jgi:endonuclease-3
VFSPPGIAEVERARIAERAHSRAAKPANDRSGACISREGADGRASAGAQKSAGCRPVTLSGSASAERKNGKQYRRRGRNLEGSRCHYPLPISPHFGFAGENGSLPESFHFIPAALCFYSRLDFATSDFPHMSRRFRSDEVVEFFTRFSKRQPDPRSELEYKNPYTLLVAVVLSAQATDRSVNKATALLFKRADSPEKMMALGEDALREAIKTIGLYRTKAKNVIALSKALIENHGGKVPRDREALEALPGVGRKTANVVLNIAFAEPTIAVDTHIFRVGNRTGLAPGKTPRDVEDRLNAVVPDRFKLHAHHWLILHGRYICVARKPRCPDCILADLCRYQPKTKPPGATPEVEGKILKKKVKTSIPRAR